ncbi:MAG: hypothetical protein LBU35_01595 [Holosporales bacterium]|jgi:hypothetical protein|nr:hypothetical protein [Holosporales bacterium]
MAMMNGYDVRCDVECWCKVFQLSGSRIVEPTYYYFPPETVILHQEGGLLRASNDSHHLGFGRDNVSRAVLYSVRYINGPIANTTKTGLILFIPNQGEYQYWTNSAYVYQNPIYQVLQAMRRDYWHLGIPFLNLLGIPPSGSI